MPQEQGILRVHGQGGVEVELIASYLGDFQYAYNSIIVFEETIEGWRDFSRHSPLPIVERDLAFLLRGRRWSNRMFREAKLTPEEIPLFVPKSAQLVLSGAVLQSPGFWDFVGKMNPLEVLRKYLADRHERRKDRGYRESAEERRLLLENLKLENEVIRGRIEVARQLGATDRDLEPLLNQLVYRPLAALNRHQDVGTIETAEMRDGFNLPDNR